MNIGFDRPLYIQPFDHRGSFQAKMFGWKGKLNKEQTAEVAAAKQVIYVGRTVFWEPLVAMRDKKISRNAAVAEVARRYQAFVDTFEKARA